MDSELQKWKPGTVALEMSASGKAHGCMMFNTNVHRAGPPHGFIMSIETTCSNATDEWEGFKVFHNIFAVHPGGADLNTGWTLLDPAHFVMPMRSEPVYLANCPTIRFLDNWYYNAFASFDYDPVSHNQTSWRLSTWVARSRDLHSWEKSASPLIAPIAAADKKLSAGFLPSAAEAVGLKAVNDTNVSDLDWVSLPNGTVYLEWAMGCQDPDVPNCNPALYAVFATTTGVGGEATWLASAFVTEDHHVAKVGRSTPRIPVMNQVVRSDWLNVYDVGAVGDGKHDDTAALQKAINMLSTDIGGLTAGKPKQHLTLYFPPGDFLTTRTLELGVNRTAHSPGGLQWVTLIGHGSATRIIWGGTGVNASMLWSNGCTRCRVEGLSFVGNHRAGVGIEHRSFSRYESRFLHINLAFDAFTVAGIRAGKKPYGTASAEMLYQNCAFSNSAAGLQLLAANQYDNSLEGCLFADCGIGLDDQIGNFYLRNSRFERSTDVDIVVSAHSNSIRRVVSVNSSSFVRVQPTSASSELKIDDCRVAGWTKAGPAVTFGARGPLQVIDSSFTDAPAGAAAVIHMSESVARVVLSGSSTTGIPLVSAAQTQPLGTVVTQVPSADRTSGPNKAITHETHFLKEVWVGPSRVIDASRDGHVAGNGIVDDTVALQATIDAVAAVNAAGEMTAVAYIPAGQYRISQPLRVKEGVHLDGSGFGSQIVLAPDFAGEAGVVVVGGVTQRSTAISVMLTNLAVDNTFANRSQPVLIKGGCGTVFVTNIHVDSNSYGCAEKPNATGHGHAPGCQSLGIKINNLTTTDTVHANVLDGRLVVSDSADGVVLVGFHVQGGSAVSHPSPMQGPAKGFLGEIFRAESFNRFDLQVNDSQSYVISDYYTEQTWQYILLGGTSADKYPGRVSIGAVKIGTNQYRFPGDDDLMPVIEVENYYGSFVHFGGHFQFETKRGNASAQRTPPLSMYQAGDAKFQALFFGDTWLWQTPRFEVNGLQTSVCTLGNIITMDALKNLTVDNRCVGDAMADAAQMQLVAAAWDHTRELGDWDLKLNHPDINENGRLKTDDSNARSRYKVFDNQQWPSCCIRPTPGCVGPPTPPSTTMTGLPDFQRWGIATNPGLAFDGSTITTVYSFGLLPFYSGMGPGGACSDGDWNCSKATAHFGGLPQLTNLSAHLEKLRADIESTFPGNPFLDPNWSGIAVVDFELWKPVLSTDAVEARGGGHHQLEIYVNRSIELARIHHPSYTEQELAVAGAAEFNVASQRFWNASFALVKKLRPKGRWGLYNYPGADSGCGVGCGADFKTRFDDSNLWLLCQTDALFPSIYLRSTNTTVNRAFVDSQLMEARRVRDAVRQHCGRRLPIFTYTWAEYYVGLALPWEQLLTPTDVETAFVRPAAMWGVAGTILWGDGEQARNLTLCGSGESSLSAWVNTTLGPAVLRASQRANTCAATRCSDHGSCVGGVERIEGGFCDCDAGWAGLMCNTQDH